jgi:hypothetical protein
MFKIYSKWTEHLKENKMTYLEHLAFAMFYGTCCIIAGILLITHSLFPCFFQTTGSDLVTKMSKRFKKQH